MIVKTKKQDITLMKKLLLSAIFASMATLCASAQQSFTVGYAAAPSSSVDDYEVIENGATLVISEVDEIDPGYMYELPCYLCIKNNTAAPLEIEADAVNDPSHTTFTNGYPQFCLWQCQSGFPAHDSGTIPAFGAQKGIGTHFNYVLEDPFFDEVDPDSPEYSGTWTGTLTITANGETFSCTLVFSNNDSGIEGVVVTDDTPAVYYNLQGVAVANPSTGNIYIERRGSKCRKVML